ncbi:MAG: dehydrogenase [Gemmatimonadetes bacterium]|nr:dehydrogenase [Gemmatimonadota bacterium]
MPTLPADEIRQKVSAIYISAGATQREADIVADLLVESNLLGHDSHGVIRVPQYVRGLEEGNIKSGAETVIDRETAATAVINGNWGFGHVTASDAMQIAIQKAKEASIGVVTVHNCHHVARLGAFPAMAAEEGLVGLITNNGHGSDKALAPWGGMGRVLPANCLAAAFPSDNDWPVAVDLTVAVAAGGKMRVAANRGEKVLMGAVVDKAGRPSDDPEQYVSLGGALAPFGGPVGHKGSALAIAIDILSGALSPAGCTQENPPVTGNALFIQVINIEAFQPLDTFRAEVGKFVDYVKATPTAEGFDEVLIPGERSYRTKQERLVNGIPVEDATWDQVEALAARLL